MVFAAVLGLILVFVIILGFIITPIAVKIGHFYGFTDKPDNHLKLHTEETPHVGGVVIFLLVSGASVAYHVLVAPLHISQIGNIGLLSVIFIIGVIDDRYHLPIFIRLGIQITIAIGVMVFGNTFTPTDIPIINILLTMTGILIMINAVNMLDGMDGLASIVSAIAILGLVYALFYYSVGQFYIFLGLVTVTSLIPFLVANFRPNPKKAFLGDGGSTYLGLILAILFIQSTNVRGRSDTVASILFISIPIFELLFVTIIRLWSRKNPLKGSKDHFPLKIRILTKSDTKTLISISLMSCFFFLAGIGILHFSTIFKYIVVIISILAYSAIWIVLARVRAD